MTKDLASDPTNNSADAELTLARLAVETWKLLRVLERAVAHVPDERRERFAAQGRYAAGRLDDLLLEQGMSVQAFDGMTFEINLPASAVNADEFAGSENAMVARTIEPAVIADMRPLLPGKVWLRGRDAMDRD